MKMKFQNFSVINIGPARFAGFLPKGILIAVILFLSAPAREVRAQESCLPPFDFSITNQAWSDIFPPGSITPPPGSSISVTGKLTFNQSATLNGLEFVMSPNSSIDITGAGTVVTAGSGTNFHGCTQMWNGISVKTGAIVQFDGVNVSDAWQGLVFLSAANTTGSGIKNSFFLDNVVGIGIYGLGSAATPFRFTEFSNVRIETTINPLLPPPNLKVYNSTIPLRGIGITQSVVDLVSGVNQKNSIKRHRYGMGIFLSTVTIANFTFSDNRVDPQIGTDLEGTDIYSYQSTLVTGGSPDNNTACAFTSAENAGVISDETRGLTVSGATFSNPDKYGIRCINSIALSTPIQIIDNIFTMNGTRTVSAIQIDRPPSGSGVISTLVKDNQIEMFAGHQKAPIVMIDIVGQFDASDLVTVEQNTIDIDKTYPQISGIHVAGKGNNYNIVNKNILSWEPASNPTYPVSTVKSSGIIANDLLGSGHSINGNIITSKLLGDKSFLKAGIDLSNNPFQTNVCENQIFNTHIGINCSASLANTFLKRNEMGNAAYGLFCKAQTGMPTQDRFENIWTGTYATWGAEYEGGNPPFNFKYDPGPAVLNDLPPSVNPSGWFVSASGSNSVCGTTGMSITHTEQQYLENVLPTDAAVSNWDGRRMLLYKLLRYPDMLTGNTGARDFLEANEQANTSAWQYARAEWLFDQAYAISVSTRESFSSLTTQYCSWSDKIRALDALQTRNAANYDENIAGKRENAFVQLSSVAEELDQMRAQTLPVVGRALQTALTYSRSLPELTDYESNLKNILKIAIRHAAGDSLLEADFAILRNIAAQCPETGGISVRRAPLWLPHEESLLWLGKDWNTNCKKERGESGNDVASHQNVQIFPNPACDLVQVLFPDNASGTWYISNITGRIIEEGQVSDAPFYIDTAHWPEGLYFLHCQNLNEANPAVKLMISHR